jgi:hypothetical protein
VAVTGSDDLDQEEDEVHAANYARAADQFLIFTRAGGFPGSFSSHCGADSYASAIQATICLCSMTINVIAICVSYNIQIRFGRCLS